MLLLKDLEVFEEDLGRRENAGDGVDSGCLNELVCLLNVRGVLTIKELKASAFLSLVYFTSQFWGLVMPVQSKVTS